MPSSRRSKVTRRLVAEAVGDLLAEGYSYEDARCVAVLMKKEQVRITNSNLYASSHCVSVAAATRCAISGSNSESREKVNNGEGENSGERRNERRNSDEKSAESIVESRRESRNETRRSQAREITTATSATGKANRFDLKWMSS